jgi:uncharacterized protein
MNVVLDTNVLISAFLNPKGTTATILNLLLNGKITLLYDNRILTEYKEVLRRKKFGFSGELIEPLLEFLRSEGLFIAANPNTIKFTDESDKMFLEVAETGGADFLITGNKAHFPNLTFIVSPREFIDLT